MNYFIVFFKDRSRHWELWTIFLSFLKIVVVTENYELFLLSFYKIVVVTENFELFLLSF